MAAGDRRRRPATGSVDEVVVDTLQALGGAAAWQSLRAAGVTWYSLHRAVADGEVLRLRRGAFALPSADEALRCALTLGGVLSCCAAARALGLPVLVLGPVHLSVPRAWGHAQLPGVTVHRRDLDADERSGVATSLLRTVVDCGRELPHHEAVVIADAALRRGLDQASLREAGRSARGKGAGAVRAMVAAAAPSAESPLESLLRLIAAPLGRVETQVVISGVGRVDLVVDGWLVLEADGFEHHSDRRSYREDRRRANALVAAGYTLLRFSYEDLVHQPGQTAAVIACVLRRGHGQARER